MRNLFLVISIFLSLFASSQTAVSPYSIFGPGELQNKGFSRTNSMGGAGIAMESGNHLNNLNPASYTGIDSMRLIFEFGVKGKSYKLKTSSASKSGFTGNFGYLGLGFRYTSWWAGSIGLVPFSSVGYTIYKKNYVQGMSSEVYYSEYVGTGGISQAYWGNAVKITKNLSLGLNISYLFGSLTQEENLISDGVVGAYQFVRQDYVKTFYFDYGLQYSFNINKWDYSLGATYSNQQKLNSRHIVNVYDASYNYVEGYEYDTDYLKVPAKLGVGLGMQKADRLTLLFDYETQNWSNVEYPNQKYDFNDSHRFAFGSEFRPWAYRAINKWYKNCIYRVGLNYESSYLVFGSKSVDKKSISFGAGIPTPGRISHINWGIEIGTNGTLSNQLIKENYVMFYLGFNLNEVAFIKRKFD